MRIVSWNVNGLRAVVRKREFTPLLHSLKPDVLLLQETKAREAQLPDEARVPKGYYAYFESSTTRSGYSGTAIYSKTEPLTVTRGMGAAREFDEEGRLITAEFGQLYVVNCYFPNGGGGPERLAYKLRFYEAFLTYVEALRTVKPVVWGGDINTAHEEIDLARPRENQEHTGFLPEERAWLDEVVGHGWIDTFRHFYPEKEGAYTYWDMKTRARDRNVGWRIDYLFLAPELAHNLKKASIHTQTMGSDHCPLSIDIEL